MATVAPRDYRPSRSNSLQKMLELEKQAMVQRQQAAGHVPASIPYNKTTPSQRPMQTRARTYSNSNVSYQRQPPPRQPNLPGPAHNNSQRIPSLPQLPPLTVNFPEFDHQHALGIASPPASSPPQDSTASTKTDRRTTLPALTKSLSSIDTLSFPLASTPTDSDERQSVCTSPSWEAYTRAKQVKKDQKEQREKEKEQALREHRAKRSRLSKQPPPLSTSAGFAAAAASQPVVKGSTKNKSDVTMGIRGPARERPASVVGLVAPTPEAFNRREGHSRSGSFSSILKAFDLRKHSGDEASPSPSGGFVGGIKLEQEKFEHSERAGEQAAEKAIEAHGKLSVTDIHPALRDGPVLDSFSPMASDASLPQQSPRAKRDHSTHAEEGKSHKWRSYIGLKKHHNHYHHHHQKRDSKDLTVSTENKRNSKILISGPILSHEAEAKVAETLAKAAPKEVSPPPVPPRLGWQFDPEGSIPALPHKPAAMEPVHEAAISVSPPSPDLARSRPSGRLAMSRSQRARRQQRRLQQADEHDIPPPPPRRSSKRKSWVALDHRAAQVPKLAISVSPPNDTLLPPLERTLSERPSSIQITPPPSPRSHQHSQLSSPSFEHDHLSPHSLQHSTCSEDSASDYSHSLSSPSTPASSRPQSDTELSPVIADIERLFLEDGPYRSEGELKEIPIRQPSIHRRSRDGRLVLDPGFVPQLEIPLEKKGRSFPLVTRKPATPADSSNDVAPLSPPAALNKTGKEDGELDGSVKPIAKVFVECCGCKYYHDLPSKLYEAISAADGTEQGQGQGQGMTVRCPWCKHGMSRTCCAGLAAMVYVKERLH